MQIFNVKSMSRFTYSIGRFCFKLDIPYVSYSAKKCMCHPTYCLDMQTHSTTKDSILEEYPFQSVDKEGQWILPTKTGMCNWQAAGCMCPI